MNPVVPANGHVGFFRINEDPYNKEVIKNINGKRPSIKGEYFTPIAAGAGLIFGIVGLIAIPIFGIRTIYHYAEYKANKSTLSEDFAGEAEINRYPKYMFSHIQIDNSKIPELKNELEKVRHQRTFIEGKAQMTAILIMAFLPYFGFAAGVAAHRSMTRSVHVELINTKIELLKRRIELMEEQQDQQLQLVDNSHRTQFPLPPAYDSLIPENG